jgi:hypothetical protein
MGFVSVFLTLSFIVVIQLMLLHEWNSQGLMNWHIATTDHFKRSSLSPSLLTVTRFVSFILNVIVTFATYMGEPAELMGTSTTKGIIPIKVVGINRLTTFTCMSWIIQGIYFGGASLVSLNIITSSEYRK